MAALVLLSAGYWRPLLPVRLRESQDVPQEIKLMARETALTSKPAVTGEQAPLALPAILSGAVI